MAADPQFLGTIPLFISMDDEERAALAAIMAQAGFKAGEVILRVDQPGGVFHLVVDGEVEISLTSEDGEKLVLDVLKSGEFFGELSLIDGGTHSATVTATQPTTTLVLKRDELLDLLMQRPHMAQDMMVALVQRIRRTDALLRGRVSRNPNEVFEEQETLGNRISDAVARFGGSWIFISSFGVVLVAWVLMNTIFMGKEAFDAYPFIFLNLILSMVAAVQAPVIMMSQNRQDFKDRIRSELDYQVNLKAELEISELLQKVSAIEDALGELRAQK